MSGPVSGPVSTEQPVLVERRGAVTVVTLNRPHAANSLDGPTMTGLGRAFAEAEADPEVRALVLTAAGGKIFCAGMDLKAFASGGLEVEGPGLGVLTSRVFPKPVVAAVTGTAVGGGLELALACDLVVASDAARFGLPEVSRGLVAAGGGTRLPRRIPLAYALELGLTGELVDAARIQEMGLVNRVVPAADVLPTALALAERIAANGPLALRVTKELMYAEIGDPDREALAAAVKPVFDGQDAVEGARAFAEKRAPRWTGR
ncbi:enoyl-CoA hydratase-related protein [Pseudonocardia pini]|uniref:enoyl-CoA hydratase-related protein n=1 Tax=Pseudonocardia pini TaxID=2758030 RepID=UPI0028A650A2|nr:enoyl-CoA hydratase-related protein [Pseudonocardia pini]